MTKDEIVKLEIIKAARRVFQKWGVNKTTMEDIAREAKKGKSSLYYYFKSKEEIFETFTTLELDNIIAKSRLAFENVNDSKSRLKAYITTMLHELKRTISLYPMLKGEVKGDPAMLEKLSKKFIKKEEAVIKEILIEGFENGEFQFLEPNQLGKAATAIVGIVHGLTLYLFIDNDDIETIDIITKIIAEGI